MEEEGNSLFQQWFNSISEKLQGSGQLSQLSATFGQLRSDHDRVAFTLQLPCVHQVFDLQPTFNPKSSAESIKLRSDGNKLFQRKQYLEALEVYTLSILKAPLEGEKRELSLAFANRSAVLYHLQKYELCLLDIEYSLKYDYPEELRYKLFDRRGKCYRQLGMSHKAEVCFIQAEDCLNCSKLDEKKKAIWTSEIESEVRKCRDITNQEGKAELNSLHQGESELPPLSFGQNRQFVAASSAFDLTVTRGRGRHPVAARDISVGDTLVIEKPYASVLLAGQTPTHCHHCLKRVSAPVPCGQCSTVRYCSEHCVRESWRSYHAVECGCLDLVHKSGIGGTGHLALRVVVKTGYTYLKDFKRTLGSNKFEKDEKLLGCNNEGLYDPAEYLPIFHLVTHSSDRAPSDLFRRTVMAVFLLKCLQRSAFFPKSAPPSDEDLAYIGSLVLKHLQVIPCNAHEVSELQLSLDSVATSETAEVASALYATLSLFNHACDPSVTRSFYGNVCVVRTLRNIPRGCEISDNYGTLSALTSKADRQAKLREQYYFTCCCEACKRGFPLYIEMAKVSSPVPFKCGECGTRLEFVGSCESEVCCASCHKVNDLQKKQKVLKRSEDLYLEAMGKLLNAADVEGSLPTFVSHLQLLDKLVCRPWKDFNNCQEALKQCYNIMSNCHVIK